MFKQLQELQNQTKLQKLNNGRQQNVMNQVSSMQNKQSSVPQFGMTNYGIPVRDPSQMFTFGDTKSGHRSSNQLAFSQARNPVISGISSSQYSPFQWPSRDSADLLTKNKSQQAATLDPLEHKILFNTGDNSGNWSALMQKAVSETSNSDSGPQEEWTGLNFQKTDVPKTENDDVPTSSFDNSSHSPYFGVRFSSSSQSPHFDPFRISKHKISTHNPLPNQNNTPNQTPQIVAVKKEIDQRWSTTRPTNSWADAAFKNENVYYENKVPQVISLFQVNSAYGNQKSQHLDQLAKKSTHAPVNLKRNDDVANQDIAVLKSKKRKFHNFEYLTWQKEASEVFSRVHDTSTTELEWAESAGRLPERLKELGEKLTGMVSCKRRLVKTTQLLQMLFRPAPAVILSDDATAHCDSVTYYAAKLALGDACGLCSASVKKRTSKSSNDQNLSKLIGMFIDRSKRLEEELSRFEKLESTIREIQMDFQDLETFAVISRFAKFHTRVALMKRDTASSGSKPKLYPQKYVKASPMPNTVPEGQNCLSL